MRGAVIGFDFGSAHYQCQCGACVTMSAVPGDGDGVVGGLDCECGGIAALRSVVFDV